MNDIPNESSVNIPGFDLEPVTNNINQLTGLSENQMFYEDFLNVLKSYGVDTQNQNTLFDTNFYSFLPPINIDKFINNIHISLDKLYIIKK